ncbi:eCIS core domain-containing protein [Haloferax larsenii]|uniref:eCIS core domain-containing protein n=1 Tax=Haloferax larsenii TaxID=302484 RepID=A0A1H7MSV2_HALLR|nr:DUF4157 domain-containing protein [Haloferax larsenii]SEL14129.1 protein of unknown function [Haloferax larsenii]
MGFRSASEKTSEGQQSSVVPSIQELTGGSDRSQRGGGSPASQDAAAQFGLEMYRPGMDVQIQRLVQSHGASQVRQWADEGMTVDTMGKPRDMREFRERQEERPAEVPKDIERRNAKSVQRSRGAHHEASKAGDAQVPDSVRDVISSPGQQLDTSIQRAMEDRMGDNLGDVRIHTGPSAAKACEDINARAFTVGNHIAFNHGEYDPSSAEGQHVLAHELAHVRQQTGGAVSMLPQEGELEIDPDERLEREAEETAQRVMRGGKIGVHRMQQSDVHVQRYPGQERVEKAREEISIRLGQDESEQGVPADPEVLAAEVDQIKHRQAQIMETLTVAEPGAATDGEWGKAAYKGVVGSLAAAGTGAILGGTAGSALPGLGTAVGAATGAAITGAVSNVTKEWVEFTNSNRPGGEGERLEQMYQEIRDMYKELKEGTTHSGKTKFGGE